MLRSSLTLGRAFGILALSLGALGQKCPESAADAQPRPEPTRPDPAATPTPVPSFQGTVRPILEVRCAPCHNPGGKMYARLPFDRAEVVAAHARGVRRRLKGEDLAVLEAWLTTLPAPTPSPSLSP